MEENKRIEMTDEELENAAGGFGIGDHVKANARMIRYCPGCGKLATVSSGTVVGKMWYEKGQYYILEVKTDCCGYVERCTDFACELY